MSHRAIIRYISNDGTARTDSHIVADFDISDNLCARADINVIAYDWRTCAFAVEERVAADCDALKDCATFTDFCCGGNKNSIKTMWRDKTIYICVQRYGGTEIAIDVGAFEASSLFLQF